MLSVSGQPFSDNMSSLNIQELFVEKINGYNISDITGWAAPNLILVNAQAKEGDNKVSFWFDVTSQSFIQLGTYFH